MVEVVVVVGGGGAVAVAHLALPLELDGLVVLELRDLLEARVHLVQREQAEVLNIVPSLSKYFKEIQ